MTAKQLERIRQRMKLTREALAAELGVSWRTVYRWEKGEVTIPEARQRHIRLLAEREGAA